MLVICMERQKTFWATLLHNFDIANGKQRNQFCSHLRTSWCLWRLHKLTPDQNSLLMPIFRDLSNETLLEKCLHGYTQNGNEAIANEANN